MRNACFVREPYFLHSFLKFKRGMPAVSFMTSPLREYMLRIYSAVIFVLAINSQKMKEMFDFFLLFSSGRVAAC